MNQQLVAEAAFIFYRKVQVAVAIFVINNRPNNDENITSYAEKFQNEYREKTERCNLRLERKILIDQLFHVVPECSHILRRKDIYPMPMEIDVVGLINADYTNFSLQLSVASELLHALIEVRILLNNERDRIRSADVLRILSKFDDLNVKNHNSYSQHAITEISVNVFKNAMQKINVEKVAKVCVSLIVKLFKSYLKILPQDDSLSRTEALIWMKKANHLLIKCMDGFAYDGQYQTVIVELLQESIRYIFTKNQSRIVWCYEDDYCKMIMKWKNHKLLCINTLCEFFIVLNKIPQDSIKMNKHKCTNLLKVIKLFLDSFCKKKFKTDNSQSTKESISDGLSIATENIPISERRVLITWAKYISNFVGKIESMNFTSIEQLALKCFNILSSTGELDKIIEIKKSKSKNSGNYLTDSNS